MPVRFSSGGNPTWCTTGPPPLSEDYSNSTSRENCFYASVPLSTYPLPQQVIRALCLFSREDKKYLARGKLTRQYDVLVSRDLLVAILLLPLIQSPDGVTGTLGPLSRPLLTMLSRVVLSAAATAGERCRSLSGLSG